MLSREQAEAEIAYKNQINALLKEVNNLKETVQSNQTEIDNLKCWVTQLEKEKASLETRAEAVQSLYEIQIRDLGKIRAEKVATDKENVLLKITNAKLSADNIELTSQVHKLCEDLQSHTISALCSEQYLEVIAKQGENIKRMHYTNKLCASLDSVILDLQHEKKQLDYEVGKLGTTIKLATQSGAVSVLEQTERRLAQVNKDLQLAKQEEKKRIMDYVTLQQKIFKEKHELQVKVTELEKELDFLRSTPKEPTEEARRRLRVNTLKTMRENNLTHTLKAEKVVAEVTTIIKELHTYKELSKVPTETITRELQKYKELYTNLDTDMGKVVETRDNALVELDATKLELHTSRLLCNTLQLDKEKIVASRNALQDGNDRLLKEVELLTEELLDVRKLISSVKASNKTLTLRSLLSVQRVHKLEIDLADARRKCTPLQLTSARLRMLEKINDTRETEYQKLARAIGYEPTATIAIFREFTNFGDKRHLDFVYLIYHQITYWNIIEFGDLSVLQVIIVNYANFIKKFAQNLDVLTHIFSGASLLLHMLYKNQGADLEDVIAVAPLQVHIVEEGGDSEYSGSESHIKASTLRAHTLDICSTFQLPLGDSGVFITSLSPSSSEVLSTNDSGFHPIRSSEDFFTQLKAIVGRCYGLLLSFVASRLDPLLSQIVLTENFSPETLPSWNLVILFLHNTLSVFQSNLVHYSLSQHFFSAVFSRINNVLMNGVLSRQQFFTEKFGAYLKTQIASLQSLVSDMDPMWISDVSTHFQGIKQVAAVLDLLDKSSLLVDEVRKAICPTLNSLQLFQLLSMFTSCESGQGIPIPIINAVGALTPRTDTDKVLLDVNTVTPFPIKILHYFEVEDMLQAAATPMIRSLVDNMKAGKE